MKTKYNYLKVIQSFHAGKWWDESLYYLDSQGRFLNDNERFLFHHDFKEYSLANHGAIRAIERREKK